ncbi:MAG: IPT/TIG domain-containing protein [Candidatus Pacebacteria bacterium]|nr:IPT/TIG domain-containing protein [Candidatus Paceibacterota bacterium]
MSKINNKNLIFVLIIIAILAVSVIFTLPRDAHADYLVPGGGFYSYETDDNGVDSSTLGSGNGEFYIPIINSISPNKINSGSGIRTIAINGSNFMQGATAKFGSQNRPTSYINSNRLLMQLSSTDTNNAGEFLITVHNPNGAYSNIAFLSITRNKNSNGTNSTGTVSGANTGGANGLGANALSSGFRLSGLVLWLFIAILILVVVILWRKIFGEKEKHKPLKHA